MLESMEIHERASDAGCYTFIGERFFVDDVIRPDLVKQIRVIDPNYVPLLCKRNYRSPAGTIIYRQYHVIGRYIEQPTEDAQPVKLETVPRGFRFDPRKIHPLRTLCANWPKGTPEWRVAMPPAEVRPDGWLVEQMRAVQKAFTLGISIGEDSKGRTGRETTQDRLNEILNAEADRDERIMADAMKEARYRARHNWRQFKEAAEKERWAPEPPDTAPKPFVDLGG